MVQVWCSKNVNMSKQIAWTTVQWGRQDGQESRRRAEEKWGKSVKM